MAGAVVALSNTCILADVSFGCHCAHSLPVVSRRAVAKPSTWPLAPPPNPHTPLLLALPAPKRMVGRICMPWPSGTPWALLPELCVASFVACPLLSAFADGHGAAVKALFAALRQLRRWCPLELFCRHAARPQSPCYPRCWRSMQGTQVRRERRQRAGGTPGRQEGRRTHR
jgi:hypothetical protein